MALFPILGSFFCASVRISRECDVNVLRLLAGNMCSRRLYDLGVWSFQSFIENPVQKSNLTVIPSSNLCYLFETFHQ